MTVNTGLEVISDEELLLRYEKACQELEDLKAWAGRIEQELVSRMEDREARAIPSESFECKLEVKHEYVPERLTPLKELLLDADLDTAYTPEHEKTVTVPESWNGTKLRALSNKYGGEVKKIVEDARIQTGRRLRVWRKE